VHPDARQLSPAARAARDWAEADRLRDELAAAGWQVRDGAAGPELVRAG
jgi:cysteinyl-tRNA synthetase